MSLADYFDELQATSDEAEARYLALTQEAETRLAALSFSPTDGWDPDVALAGEQLLRAITDEARFTEQAADVDLRIYAGLQDMLTFILSRIKAIDPPEEAIDPHSEMVAAAAAWAELVTDVTDALTEAGSAQELAERLAPLHLDGRYDAIEVRFRSACLALQAVADVDDQATFQVKAWLGGVSSEGATAAFACG